MFKALYVLTVLIFLPKVCYAYLDPSTIQVFLAGLLGFFSAIILYAKTILKKIMKLLNKNKKNEK